MCPGIEPNYFSKIYNYNYFLRVNEIFITSLPIALYSGLPVNLSHKRVVSRWFVKPTTIFFRIIKKKCLFYKTAIVSLIRKLKPFIALWDKPIWAKYSLTFSMHSITESIINCGSISTHLLLFYRKLIWKNKKLWMIV